MFPPGVVADTSVMALPADPAVTAVKVTTLTAAEATTSVANELAVSLMAATISAAMPSVVPLLTEKSLLPEVLTPAVPVSAAPLTVMVSPVARGAAFTVTVPVANVSAPSIRTQDCVAEVLVIVIPRRRTSCGVVAIAALISTVSLAPLLVMVTPPSPTRYVPSFWMVTFSV